MRAGKFTATPHPAGNRIDLAWELPAGADGARLVRRAGTFPVHPDDGVVVAEGPALAAALDAPLRGEEVCYYALFPYQGDPPVYDVDAHNRVAVMATSPYDYAGWMHSLLPAIYHRYDTVTPAVVPPGMAAADVARGQLRRFLDLPGAQLDQLHSFARAMLGWRDPDRIDGRLLPRLADWIGWKTDHRLEIEAQRNEVRNAPAIYRTLQIVPTVEATVKRISGWESRSKEFVHNLCASNRPESLNLWSSRRPGTGAWVHDADPLSLDFAYEGRPTAVWAAAGNLWLIYHTQRRGRWSLWYKIYDPAAGWSASRPLGEGLSTDKHPSVVPAGGTPWVFWNRFDPETQRGRVLHSAWAGTHWNEPVSFPPASLGLDPQTDRRRPAAVIAGNGDVWLFWQEKGASGWGLRYSRYDGSDWGAVQDFPLDGGADPRVDAEPFVLFQASGPRLWVWWTRRGADGTHWEVAYRIKQDASLDAANWTPVRTLPKDGIDPLHHDRAPAAFVNANGEVEVYWSSMRGDQGWSLWQSQPLDANATTWAPAQRITVGPYTVTDPLALNVGTESWLIYRASRHVRYRSAVYGATETLDMRYAGATSAHTRNRRKIALRGALEDCSTYTYDTGTGGTRNNDDWYARDTLGLYLSTDTLATDSVTAGVDRLRQVLGEFMPVTDRAVFVAQHDLQAEYVYDYAVPGAPAPHYIAETHVDALSIALMESALGPGEDFVDNLE